MDDQSDCARVQFWTARRLLGDDVHTVEAKVAGLAEQLRNLRIARGLKQTVAAERIGRSEHWLVDLEAARLIRDCPTSPRSLRSTTLTLWRCFVVTRGRDVTDRSC